jgi:hypothetical protein
VPPEPAEGRSRQTGVPSRSAPRLLALLLAVPWSLTAHVTSAHLVTADGASRTTSIFTSAVPDWPDSPVALACPQSERGVWTTDPGKPHREVTLYDALRGLDEVKTGAPVLVTSDATRAVAAFYEEGRVVAVVWLRRWNGTGGWFVESGTNCTGW